MLRFEEANKSVCSQGREKSITPKAGGHRPTHIAKQTDLPQLCTHVLFEMQAAATPDAIAVLAGERRLTYRELNERANRIAYHLSKRGVGPETLVGVCLERSTDMVASLLGVWKAGGAYIPLDPAYPVQRLSFMVDDGGVQALITDRTTRHLFSLQERIVDLDASDRFIAAERTDNPCVNTKLSELAYVMYTSGSTGQPKGAMIQHGGLANYLGWAIREYSVGAAGGAVPVHSSLSFDLTVTSLYPALLVGGQVELVPDEPGAQGLLKALRRFGDRTLVKITPAHLEILSREIEPSEAPGMVRTFVIGGENLTVESLRFWRQHAPTTRLINEYGPTETVVGCCTYEVRADDPDEGSVPIGHPIANTRLYVLDSHLRQVSPGTIGELHIGGAGVARGYLNGPELTDERFLADPFSEDAGARMYRTGDLARYRDDGILEYHGRIDEQVKIRGYRIELGEIEQSVMAYPAVGACVVVTREDVPGDKQLVAYVVPRLEGERELEIGILGEFLQTRLPEYMVPSRVVLLQTFPLTLNGKVDRRALPPPPPRSEEASSSDDCAKSATQKAVAAILMDLLNLQRIGVNDNVFDLGANSYLAIRALSQIKTVFGVHVPTRNLYEAPTVAGLAAVVDQLSWARGHAQGEKIGTREEIAL